MGPSTVTTGEHAIACIWGVNGPSSGSCDSSETRWSMRSAPAAGNRAGFGLPKRANDGRGERATRGEVAGAENVGPTGEIVIVVRDVKRLEDFVKPEKVSSLSEETTWRCDICGSLSQATSPHPAT